MPDTILIIDFGSQVTQLIARRLREKSIFTEILPSSVLDETDMAKRLAGVKGVILSGGPNSVTRTDTPRAPAEVFEAGIPLLGICYGQQTICAQLGGKVEAGNSREFGRAEIDILARSPLFDGVWPEGSAQTVWMSHGDKVISLPKDFKSIASSSNTKFAAVENKKKSYYGLQFHPEVVHTPNGHKIIENFIFKIFHFLIY